VVFPVVSSQSDPVPAHRRPEFLGHNSLLSNHMYLCALVRLTLGGHVTFAGRFPAFWGDWASHSFSPHGVIAHPQALAAWVLVAYPTSSDNRKWGERRRDRAWETGARF
jgi:hypothetical protein